VLGALGVGLLWFVALHVARSAAAWYPSWVTSYWWTGLWLVVGLLWRTAAPARAFWLTVTLFPIGYRMGLQSDVHVLPLLVVAFGATRAAAISAPVVVVASAAAILALMTSGGLAMDSGGTLHRIGWALPADRSRIVLLLATAVAATVLGQVIHRLAETTASLAERNAELLALQELRAREAVTAERTRLARELHDVVAHHVSAIVVRAQAADRVADAQPEAPREAVRWIAGAGREALDSMRSVVRVLREDDPQPAQLAPVPGLADLPEVVDRARQTGLQVELNLPTDTPRCAPAVGLALVRVAQEALTNVFVHSTAVRAVVELSEHDDEVVLVVADPGPARSGSGPDGVGRSGSPRVGNGLVHMHERVESCGGRIAAGPDGAGGWRVRAVAPLSGR